MAEYIIKSYEKNQIEARYKFLETAGFLAGIFIGALPQHWKYLGFGGSAFCRANSAAVPL